MIFVIVVINVLDVSVGLILSFLSINGIIVLVNLVIIRLMIIVSVSMMLSIVVLN